MNSEDNKKIKQIIRDKRNVLSKSLKVLGYMCNPCKIRLGIAIKKRTLKPAKEFLEDIMCEECKNKMKEITNG